MPPRPRPSRAPASRRRRGRLAGAHVVITGGPTREHLDDIRFLSNASTGTMGVELARAARRRGADVTLVLGPTHLEVPASVVRIDVVSTQDLLDRTREAIEHADVAIFAAAPSDWRPRRRRRGKPAREGGDLSLDLVATPDVAATVGRHKGTRVHVGFALEVRGGVKRARAKLVRKHLDAIVLNSAANFGAGGGDAAWVLGEGPPDPLPTESKAGLARAVLDRVVTLRAARER